jgi:hypothetical protein
MGERYTHITATFKLNVTRQEQDYSCSIFSCRQSQCRYQLYLFCNRH